MGKADKVDHEVEGGKETAPNAGEVAVIGSEGSPGASKELRLFAWFAGALVLAYGWHFVALVNHALGESIHSHLVLIPVVSAYLIHSDRARLPGTFHGSPTSVWGWVLAIIGLGSLSIALLFGRDGGWSHNDFLALTTFSFLCLLVGGGFFFLGKELMKAVAFPAAFLIFMMPLPDAALYWFEVWLMRASAESTEFFFWLFGTTYFRDGQVFQLPGITLRVAQECSGIRSSYVLVITSLLASYMLLKSSWRRAVLVAVIIPLGILRNGFRILVIGLLCIHKGPHWVDSDLHHRGGPIFFALSLIPLFLLLWVLRRGEREEKDGAAEEDEGGEHGI